MTEERKWPSPQPERRGVGVRDEPVAYGAAATLIVVVLSRYGLDVTVDQMVAVVGVVVAVVGWLTRRQVAPMRRVVDLVANAATAAVLGDRLRSPRPRE